MHNLLTTSVHNLMTLTLHEVLTLYTTSAQTQYQLTAPGSPHQILLMLKVVTFTCYVTCCVPQGESLYYRQFSPESFS